MADRRRPIPGGEQEEEPFIRLRYVRSDIPAVTHVDFSTRIQSVKKDTNRMYYELISEFKN